MILNIQSTTNGFGLQLVIKSVEVLLSLTFNNKLVRQKKSWVMSNLILSSAFHCMQKINLLICQEVP